MSDKPKFDPAVHDENPEWTEADFARAAHFDPPVRLSKIGADEFVRRMKRGRQKAPTKIPVSLRLSPEVVKHFKSTGPGWQGRIDDALRKIAKVRAS